MKNILQSLILLGFLFFSIASAKPASAVVFTGELHISNNWGQSAPGIVNVVFKQTRAIVPQGEYPRCRSAFNFDWSNTCLNIDNEATFTVTSTSRGNSIVGVRVGATCDSAQPLPGNPVPSIDITLNSRTPTGCVVFDWQAPQGPQCNPFCGFTNSCIPCQQPASCPCGGTPPACNLCPPPPVIGPSPTPVPTTSPFGYMCSPTLNSCVQTNFCIPGRDAGCYATSGQCSPTCSTPTPPPVALPDLVVEGLNPPWNPLNPVNSLTRLTGNSQRFSGVVTNRGAGDAGPSTAALFMFYNIRPGMPLPTPQFYRIDSSLRSQTSRQVFWDIQNIPPGLHAYAIAANVNPADRVTESNPNNNLGLAAFAYFPPPTPFTLNQPAAPRCQGTSTEPVNLSWGSSAGAENYEVWRVTTGGNWTNLTGTPLPAAATSYTDSTVQNDTVYLYSVVATSTSGKTLPSNNPPYVLVQTSACQPPTISSVNIIQGSTNTTFSGAGRTSGLLSDESGSNWRNSIFVTLNANPAAPSTVPIKESYLTFQDGPQLAHTTAAGSIPGCGNYCVREDNQWKDVPPTGRNIPQGCTPLVDCLYRILQRSGASWEVFFYGRFGSKSMNISGYVKDGNGLCSTNSCQDANLNALQQP